MSQCRLSLDLFTKHLRDGFAELQHSEEFVDMTIAADDHLVKVHKNLMALSSPFVKEMIKSAPCPHPVIFLGDISKHTLTYILEYIYTGEVNVKTEHVNELIIAAKLLRLRGLESMTLPPHMRFGPSYSVNGEGDKTDCIESVDEDTENYATEDYEIEYINSENNPLELGDTVNETNDCGEENKISENNPLELGDIKNESGEENMNLANNPLELDDIENERYDCGEENMNLENNPIELGNIENERNYCGEENMNLENNPLELGNTVNETNDHGEPRRVIDITGQIVNLDSQDHNYITQNSNNLDIIDNDAPQIENEDLGDNNHYGINNDVNDDIDMQILDPIEPENTTVDAPSSSVPFIPSITVSIDLKNQTNIQTQNPVKQIDVSAGKVPFIYYTGSGRGSVQLIANRFIYYLHHTAKAGSKCRWRCVDYRKKKCRAYIDTVDGVLTVRKFNHMHPLHDDRIHKVGSRFGTYSTVEDARTSIAALNEKSDVEFSDSD